MSVDLSPPAARDPVTHAQRGRGRPEVPIRPSEQREALPADQLVRASARSRAWVHEHDLTHRQPGSELSRDGVGPGLSA